MAVITVPSGGIRSIEWIKPQPVATYVRSAWTQRRTAIANGYYTPWRANVTVAPQSLAELHEWRRFMAEALNVENEFFLTAVETPQQTYPEVPQVNGTQTGNVILTDGWHANVVNLKAGQLVSFTSPEQMCIVQNEIFTGVDGVASLTIYPPARYPLTDNGQIQAQTPRCRMALTQAPAGWSVEPGGVYQPLSFSCEEIW